MATKMNGVEDALEREMRSYRQRSVITLMLVYALVAYVDAPQMLLIMFIAPPENAFQQNPNARDAQTITSEWHFSKSEVEWIPGLLQSVFFLGFMIGTILVGQLSDKYGRKSVGWKAYTLGLMFWLPHAFVRSWQTMAFFRILSGFFVGGLSVVNRIMFQESLASNLWAFTGVFSSFISGCFLIFIVTCSYYFPSWRTLCIVTTLPMPLGYLFYGFLPETPRWLVSHGRLQEAWRAVGIFARRNGSDAPMPEYEKQELVGSNCSSEQGRYSVLDLLRYRIFRRKTLLLGFIWFVTSFVYYGITLGAGAFSSNFYLAVGMSALCQLPAAPICIFFMQREWWGRRRSLVGFMFLSAACLFAIYLLSSKSGYASYRLPLSMAAKLGSQAAFSLIYVYTTELYPTVLRNVGLGSMSTCARVGCMAAPFAASYAVHSGSDSPFFLYAMLCAVSGFATLFLPETLGRRILNTVEETRRLEG